MVAATPYSFTNLSLESMTKESIAPGGMYTSVLEETCVEKPLKLEQQINTRCRANINKTDKYTAIPLVFPNTTPTVSPVVTS